MKIRFRQWKQEVDTEKKKQTNSGRYEKIIIIFYILGMIIERVGIREK